MVLSQNISVALGVLTLCALVGAGVGVGSGVAMMSMAADEQAKKDTSAAAHSPLEHRLSFRTFASQQ